jgi:hypothetical protein
MSPDSYFRISPIVAPLATIIGALIFSVGALRSRQRLPLGVIAIGGWLLAASNSYWLILQIQKLSGTLLLPRTTADALFPAMALCFYVGLCVVIVGDLILVYRLSKRDDAHHI